MATASERIPVLVTPQEKALISKMAHDAHMSMGELLRRAAASFRPHEEDEILEGMIGQIRKTTAQANAAVDEALAFVEASEQRIAAMESERVR
ncbi:hypothetical protein [Acidithiobacillus sp. AMEEHan]|uniref:plasmid mobilization protein n=1 Tax=Acidithiobacillus sp. AMEEHan TaxID=2994951 RepID=UPI0027E47404|nr:hypothetical protein [Acidithiobacillus sp. AMEEHan]